MHVHVYKYVNMMWTNLMQTYNYSICTVHGTSELAKVTLGLVILSFVDWLSAPFFLNVLKYGKMNMDLGTCPIVSSSWRVHYWRFHCMYVHVDTVEPPIMDPPRRGQLNILHTINYVCM